MTLPCHPEGAFPKEGTQGLGFTGMHPPEPGEVHLWFVRSDQLTGLLESGVPALPEDLRHVRRFPQGPRREARLARRVWMRLVLARALGLRTEELHIRRGPRGKPYMESRGMDVRFNLSHSGGLVVLALSTSEVGVDVERKRTRPLSSRMVSGIASTSEARILFALGEPALTTQSLRMWVRKEALLKAVGEGIREPLGHLQVLGGEWPSGGRVEFQILGPPVSFEGLSLWDFSPDRSCLGALAVRHPAPVLKFGWWMQSAWEDS